MREEEGNYNGLKDFGELLRHELNNPLTGILGNAELLLVELQRQEPQLPEQARARLETIALLAVRMRETVRRLSDDWQAHSIDLAHQSSDIHTPALR
jgi:signal transduction histidine kinase